MPAVRTRTTPGETVDVVVTEAGIAVNPRRPEIAARLAAAGLPVVSIAELRARAEARAERVAPPRSEGRIVAHSEYRDGTVTDSVRQIGE